MDPDHGCGNGILLNEELVPGNDPTDANVANSPAFQATFVQHLLDTWGAAGSGGVRYYLLDNEHAIWHETHRDVHPVGAGYDEMAGKMLDYARMIKSLDPGRWWSARRSSAGPGTFTAGWTSRPATPPRRWGTSPAGPTLRTGPPTGARTTCPSSWTSSGWPSRPSGGCSTWFSLHYYPQADGVFDGGLDDGTQDLRSRSTRALWDPTYVDESFIGEPVRLIPRIKEWVDQFYPGTPTGLTEYHWGAEDHINGGTAQADVLGIFGREGLDLATHYTDGPLSPTSFVARAFQIYRNYDGQRATFGDTSVQTVAGHGGGSPLADHLGAYGALRSSDGALTLMVISKYRTGDTPLQVSLAGFPAGLSAEVWRFSAEAGGAIRRLDDVAVGASGSVDTVPAQSVTLYVVRAAAGALPTVTLALNQGAFGPGQTLVLTGVLQPGSAPGPVVDVYVVVRLPGDQVFSFVGTGFVPGFVAIAAGVTPFPFSGEVLRYTFGGGEPGGDYLVQAGLTEAGTANVIGAIASQAFSFGP